MTDKTGGPAFPVPCPTIQNGEWVYANSGMTLRDYFAAKASDADVEAQGDVLSLKSPYGIKPDGWRTKARYMHADAMLAERNK